MKRIFSVFVLLNVVITFAGCARQISSGVYSGAHVGESSATYSGVIVAARPVMIEDKEYLGENPLGIIGGGAAGAYAGSKVGKGEGNTLATVGGALAGAAAGAFAEKALKKQNGMEYIVSLENGESRTIVQGTDPVLGVGQNVWLIVGQKGRSRVTPRY